MRHMSRRDPRKRTSLDLLRLPFRLPSSLRQHDRRSPCHYFKRASRRMGMRHLLYSETNSASYLYKLLKHTLCTYFMYNCKREFHYINFVQPSTEKEKKYLFRSCPKNQGCTCIVPSTKKFLKTFNQNCLDLTRTKAQNSLNTKKTRT